MTQNGAKIASDFAKSVYNVLTRIIADAESLTFDRSLSKWSASRDARVGDYLHVKFIEAVKEHLNIELTLGSLAKADAHSLERLLYGIFLMRLKRENIRSGTSNVFDVSLVNFAAYQEFPGISYVELKHGYRPVLDAFMSEHKRDLTTRTRLQHHLKKILLDSRLGATGSHAGVFDTKSDEVRAQFTDDKNKAVLILCDEKSGEKPRDVVVIADNVICTLTLGYLKENMNNIVEPLSFVSDKRREAVSRLGFGTINKASPQVYFLFSKIKPKKWPTKFYVF